MRRGMRIRLFHLLVLAIGACGDMGATPGGAQDNGLANQQIEQGGVPEAEDITVAGMLNQHDLPLETPSCTTSLCINAGYGVAPALDTDRGAVFVQIGFASGIDPATFHRAPLNLAVVVDRSGSMGGEKLASVKTALGKLIDQLDEGDRFALVLFDDQIDVLQASAPVTDRAALKAKVDGIYARGSTDMAAGLDAGYDQVEAGHTVGLSDRVMVFTDAMTNTGDLDTETFISLATTHGAEGIGLTVFGVGIDLNQELVLAVSALRGGNYLYLADAERIATVFDEDFDYLVTPLAYDLAFSLVPSAGFQVTAVYGYDAWQAGDGVDLDVPTVFLSRNHGAIVARLEPTGAWPGGQPPLAELGLSYSPADGGAPVSASMTIQHVGEEALGDGAAFYSQRAVRKTVALVNAAVGLARACGAYWQGSGDDARAVVERVIDLLAVEGAFLDDDADLATERALAEKLLANMGSGSGGEACTDGACDGMQACAVAAGRPAAFPVAALLLGLALVLKRGRRA
jgi:Ca-activated chloride channel homolog